MILINTKTDQAYNVNQAKAAELIGVHRVTISRWKKLREVEIYNFWKLYFKNTDVTHRSYM